MQENSFIEFLDHIKEQVQCGNIIIKNYMTEQDLTPDEREKYHEGKIVIDCAIKIKQNLCIKKSGRTIEEWVQMVNKELKETPSKNGLFRSVYANTKMWEKFFEYKRAKNDCGKIENCFWHEQNDLGDYEFRIK